MHVYMNINMHVLLTYYKKEGSQCLYKFVSSVQTVQCSVEAGTMKRATMNVIKMEIRYVLKDTEMC